jgi:hypothetical protein
MDLGKALQTLYAERQRLEHVITALQALQQGDATTPPPQHFRRCGHASAQCRKDFPQARICISSGADALVRDRPLAGPPGFGST